MMMTDRNRQHSDRPRIIAAGILPALFLAALLIWSIVSLGRGN